MRRYVAMRIKPANTYEVLCLYYNINIVIFLKFSATFMATFMDVLYEGHHNQCTNIKH